MSSEQSWEMITRAIMDFNGVRRVCAYDRTLDWEWKILDVSYHESEDYY